jgi:hypothetical protein
MGRATTKWRWNFVMPSAEPTAIPGWSFHLHRYQTCGRNHGFWFVRSLIFVAYPTPSTRCSRRQLAGSSGSANANLDWIGGWIGSGTNALAQAGGQTTSEACSVAFIVARSPHSTPYPKRDAIGGFAEGHRGHEDGANLTCGLSMTTTQLFDAGSWPVGSS